MVRHLLPVGLVLVVSTVWVPDATAQFRMPKVGGWAGEAGRRASQGTKDLSSDMDDAWRKRGPPESRAHLPGFASPRTPDLVVVEGDPIPMKRQRASSAVAPQRANKADPWRQFSEAIGRQIRENQPDQMQQNQRWNNGYRQNNDQYQQNGYRQINYRQNGYRQQSPRSHQGNVVVHESSPVYVDQGVVTTSGATVVTARSVISAAVPVNALPYKGRA